MKIKKYLIAYLPPACMAENKYQQAKSNIKLDKH